MITNLIANLRRLYVQNGTNYVQQAADTIEAQAKHIAELEKAGNEWYEAHNKKRIQLAEQAKQIEALAEVERLKVEASTQQNNGAELLELRAQLAALQYEGELPEPDFKYQLYDDTPIFDYYTADQLRQAIANALAKQIKDNAGVDHE